MADARPAPWRRSRIVRSSFHWFDDDLASKDGGKTWEDRSAAASVIPGGKFYSLFAADENNVWIGAWKGGLYPTTTGGK